MVIFLVFTGLLFSDLVYKYKSEWLNSWEKNTHFLPTETQWQFNSLHEGQEQGLTKEVVLVC